MKSAIHLVWLILIWDIVQIDGVGIHRLVSHSCNPFVFSSELSAFQVQNLGTLKSNSSIIPGDARYTRDIPSEMPSFIVLSCVSICEKSCKRLTSTSNLQCFVVMSVALQVAETDCLVSQCLKLRALASLLTRASSE